MKRKNLPCSHVQEGVWWAQSKTCENMGCSRKIWGILAATQMGCLRCKKRWERLESTTGFVIQESIQGISRSGRYYMLRVQPYIQIPPWSQPNRRLASGVRSHLDPFPDHVRSFHGDVKLWLTAFAWVEYLKGQSTGPSMSVLYRYTYL